MKMTRVIKHKSFVSSYLFKLRLEIINTTLTASRKGGLSDDCIKKIENNAFLIRKYERRKRLLKY